MVVLFFVLIGAMRVMQKICSKKVSNDINDGTDFFHYGGYYQLVATFLSLISLTIEGFYGFTIETLLCALVSAGLFALEEFASIQAMKGTSLVVCNMFSTGGIFIPCVCGIFLFNEKMSIVQWLGLLIFIISIYFLTAKKEKEEKIFSLKTFFMLLLCLLTGGLVMVVQKYFAILVPNGNISLFSALTFGLNAIIFYAGMGVCVFKNKREEKAEAQVKRVKPLSKTFLACGALLAVSLFVINLLVTYMASTVSSVILFTVSSAISIIITCLVGALVFGEKLTAKNIVGLVLGFVAIVMVNAL